MRVVGITRVRDEELLLEDTLNSMLAFCDRVIVLDDCSRDGTRTVAERFPESRVRLILNEEWDGDRQRAETADRRRLLSAARDERPDWIVYMDADERLPSSVRDELERTSMRVKGLRFRLYDAYLTQDLHAPYVRGDITATPRLFGPEFRPILMAWRGSAAFAYLGRDQREPVPGLGMKVETGDSEVRHYGKAVSIEEWDRTCDYYSQNFPEPYRSRWLARKGRPFHTSSVEGRDLHRWPVPPSTRVPMAVERARGPRYLTRRIQATFEGARLIYFGERPRS